MKSEDFCPLCGKKDGRFIKGLCKECFLKKHELVEIPDQIEFEQCSTCNKVKLFGKLVLISKEGLASFAKKKVKVKDLENGSVSVSVEEVEDETFIAHVLVKGLLDSVPLSFEKDVPLIPITVQCDACMRLLSQYHEAIVQLRSLDKKNLERALPALINAIEEQHSKDSLAKVTETKKVRNGFDLKVGSKKASFNAMKKMQKMFKAETKMSNKLLGRDNKGGLKHRFTFLVRV